MTTDHAQRVYEKYRQEGREQVLAFLIENGFIRESMLGGFVARLVDTPPENVWPLIDLSKDISTWQPKEK